MMKTHAGYVAIVGKPNAGKSTLMNAIVGAKLSITTPKPQTTRKRVVGIYTNKENQIVFTDTPGMLEPRYELHKVMMDYVNQALEESDVVLMIFDVREFSNGLKLPKHFLQAIRNTDKPVILALNKIDLLKNVKEVLPMIMHFSEMGIFREIVPISALKSAETDGLVNVLMKYLPENEFYFDEEFLSTLNERFFVSELIREQVFTQLKDELPYSSEVNIAEFKEREKGKWFISAEIIVERSSQKRIVIGEKGARIKEIGEKARREIEAHLEMPVFLELFVKVRDKWRNDKNMLRNFGY